MKFAMFYEILGMRSGRLKRELSSSASVHGLRQREEFS
jgi:hypothetical protein